MKRGEALALQDVDGPLTRRSVRDANTRGHMACDSI